VKRLMLNEGFRTDSWSSFLRSLRLKTSHRWLSRHGQDMSFLLCITY
jgi:hypothetical protein